MEHKVKHKEEEKGPFFFGIYINKEWYIKLCIVGVIIVSAIIVTWILSVYDENPTNLMNSLFYFFSATAQTLGAIVAIILTGVFALVTFMKSNEHPGYEPSKRLLFKDKSLVNAIQLSFLSIFLSLLSLLLTKNLEIKFSFLYYSIFVLLIVVITLSIIGVMFLVDFIFKKSFYYLNPDALIKRIFLNDSLNVNLLNTMSRNTVIDYTILSLFCWSNGNKCLYTKNSMDILHNYFKDKIYFHTYFKLFTDKLLDDITQIRNKSNYEELFYEDVIATILHSFDFNEIIVCHPELNKCIKNKCCDKIANRKVIIVFIKQFFDRIPDKYKTILYYIVFEILDAKIIKLISFYFGSTDKIFYNTYYLEFFIDFIELADDMFSNNNAVYDHIIERGVVFYNKYLLHLFNMLHSAGKNINDLNDDPTYTSLNKKTYNLMLKNLIRELYFFLYKNDTIIDKIHCRSMIDIILRNLKEFKYLNDGNVLNSINIVHAEDSCEIKMILSILLNIDLPSYNFGYPDRTIQALKHIITNNIQTGLDNTKVREILECIEENKQNNSRCFYRYFCYGDIINLNYLNKANNEILMKTETKEETLENLIAYFTKKDQKFSKEYFLFGIKTKEVEDKIINQSISE